MFRLRARALLLREILLAYVEVRRLRGRRDLQRTLDEVRPRGLGGACSGAISPRDLHEALRLGRATERALRALPVDSRCLTSALVVSRLLARRQIPSTLVIGVLPGKPFRAHAWVEVGRHPVLHPGEGAVERLTEL